MRRVLPVLCASALLLAACGGGGDSSETTPTDSAQESDSSATTQPSTEATDAPDTESDSSTGGDTSGLPPGGSGTVTIDGETIESRWVGNCIIDEMFDPHPDALDLTAALDGGLNALFIEISYEEISDGTIGRFYADLQRQDDSGGYASYEMVDSYLQAPDGNWYLETPDSGLYIALFTGQEYDDEPLSEPPVVITGDTVAGRAQLQSETGESVEVTFDLSYVEAVDCSL